jgi:glycine cleavage system H lipoate-binding protein
MNQEPEMETRWAHPPSDREETPCIWMQGGVVSRKFCENNYACASCKFDKALGRAADQNRRRMREGRGIEGKRGRIVSWKDKLRARPPSRRPCIHHMKGRIEFRACHHDYHCANCGFDQFYNDQFAVHAVVNPIDPMEVKGFMVPQGYYFHRGHAWVKVEDGAQVRVGIDAFALGLLGPFDRIQSPLLGGEVCQDRPDIVAFRGNLRAGVLSPVSGVVAAVNPRLWEDGSLASRQPYSEGWVMTVHSTDLRHDLKRLMIHRETEAFMETEVNDLYQLIEEVAGPLTADGGDLRRDIFGGMPALGWERLTRRFLKS